MKVDKSDAYLILLASAKEMAGKIPQGQERKVVTWPERFLYRVVLKIRVIAIFEGR